LARAKAAAFDVAPSESRGRLRPAKDDDREPEAKADGLSIESWDNSNIGVSNGGAVPGAGISVEDR
jgi:hypothetical protein